MGVDDLLELESYAGLSVIVLGGNVSAFPRMPLFTLVYVCDLNRFRIIEATVIPRTFLIRSMAFLFLRIDRCILTNCMGFVAIPLNTPISISLFLLKVRVHILTLTSHVATRTKQKYGESNKYILVFRLFPDIGLIGRGKSVGSKESIIRDESFSCNHHNCKSIGNFSVK